MIVLTGKTGASGNPEWNHNKHAFNIHSCLSDETDFFADVAR